jgi:hypothetical protein
VLVIDQKTTLPRHSFMAHKSWDQQNLPTAESFAIERGRILSLQIDLMSISGHKVYGPKGVGALYVRRRPRVRLEAQISGGGQERGLRSGTVPAPLVVGLGAACDVARRVCLVGWVGVGLVI